MGVKVLEVCAKLNIGGAQLVTANIASYVPEDYAFTYLVFGDEIGEYESEITARGHSVLHIKTPHSGYIRYLRTLVSLMRRERFDAVHCHTMYSCGIVMLAARLSGIRGRICHSHTSKDNARQTLRRKCFIALMRFLIRRCATDLWACGVDAGRELYGAKTFDRHGTVIPNGIDFPAFRYREESALAVRRRYSLEDAFVIGHVGHYVQVKNQSFLISLMPAVLERCPNAVLVMFGEGADRVTLSAQIDSLGLTNHARLMGNVRDIPKVLSAFDLFVFPSLFEGTPIALIEAQANGLPCLISDRIPPDACKTELIRRIPLEAPEVWIDAIVSTRRNPNTDAPAHLESQYDSVQRSMDRMYHVFQKYAEQGKKI